MNKNGTLQLEARGDREVAITGTFDAPSELLFEAWTKPEYVRQWWGCNGATLTVCEIDLRPGGAWCFVMRMSGGSEHPLKGDSREIVAPQLLVCTECYDMPTIGSPQWLTTVTFEERSHRTKLTNTLLHQSAAARDGHLQAGMEAVMVQKP